MSVWAGLKLSVVPSAATLLSGMLMARAISCCELCRQLPSLLQVMPYLSQICPAMGRFEQVKCCTPFIGLQAEYSLVERTPERDLIPMAQELNIGVLPWSPLADGLLTEKHREAHQKYLQETGETSKSGMEIDRGEMVTNRFNQIDIDRGEMVVNRFNQRNLTVTEAVTKIADEIGRSPAQVALNWLLQKPGVASIILGARTVKQLEDNLACLDFVLSLDQMEHLDRVSQIDLGFPHAFIYSDTIKQFISGGAKIQGR